MVKNLIAALVLGLFLTTVSFAQPQQCITPKMVVEEVMTVNRGANIEDAMTGTRAKQFMEVFNNFGEKTDVVADSVIVFTSPQHPVAMILFFQNGCAVGQAHIHIQGYMELLREIEGV